MTVKKDELTIISKDELTWSQMEDGESFWVLQKPGTDQTVMNFVDGKPDGPITFDSEEKAIEFANHYDVSHEMVPTFHTVKFPRN